MSGIYKTIEIDYKGKAYKVRPTFDFINSLEESYGVNLLVAIQDVVKQSLSVTKCVKIVACALDFAGCKTNNQEILDEYGTFGGDLIRIAADIVISCNYNPVSAELEKK
jgi:hypothetical protein